MRGHHQCVNSLRNLSSLSEIGSKFCHHNTTWIALNVSLVFLPLGRLVFMLTSRIRLLQLNDRNDGCYKLIATYRSIKCKRAQYMERTTFVFIKTNWEDHELIINKRSLY